MDFEYLVLNHNLDPDLQEINKKLNIDNYVVSKRK